MKQNYRSNINQIPNTRNPIDPSVFCADMLIHSRMQHRSMFIFRTVSWIITGPALAVHLQRWVYHPRSGYQKSSSCVSKTGTHSRIARIGRKPPRLGSMNNHDATRSLQDEAIGCDDVHKPLHLILPRSGPPLLQLAINQIHECIYH